MNGKERGRKLRDAVFAAYAEQQETRRPNSVRPGDIGKPCTRALWYAFHWADKLEKFEGRMLRLFETGHSQEDRLLADLRRVGGHVIARDPDDAIKQISIRTLGGHMTGYLDGVASNVPFALAEWVLTECKTHNDKSFKALVADGVEVAKPEHFAQMQIYLDEHKLEEALYCAVGKNDDDLYFEFVAHNPSYIARLRQKAHFVAFSPRPPAKINEKPEYYLCKMCKGFDVCHRGELPERNCRTCRESVCVETKCVPVGSKPEPIWHCGLHNRPLTLDEQRAGCGDHRYNEGLVNGKMIEEGDTSHGFAITYQMNGTGEIWQDVGPAEKMAAPTFTAAE